jgi:hypothetical protein
MDAIRYPPQGPAPPGLGASVIECMTGPYIVFQQHMAVIETFQNLPAMSIPPYMVDGNRYVLVAVQRNNCD